MSLRFAQLVVGSNQAHSLARALDSVLAQSVLPDEIVVGDDGSSDDSGDVIEDYVRRHPKRIRPVLLERSRGAAALRNACVLASGADLISILQADEELLPGKLEAELAAVRAHFPAFEVFYSSARVTSARGARMRTLPRRPQEGGLFLPLARQRLRLHGAIFSRRLYDEIGGFDERLTTCADWKFELELALRTRIKYVPGVFAVRPERVEFADARSASTQRDCVESACEDVRRRHGLLPAERRALAAARQHFAWRAEPSLAGALWHLLRACLADPTWLGRYARLAVLRLRAPVRAA